MAVSMTKVRSFIAGVFALLCVIVLASVALTGAGMDLPIARNIAGIFGIAPGGE